MESSPTPRPVARPRKRRSGRSLTIGVIVVGLIAAGAWWGWRKYAQATTTQGTTVELVAVQRGAIEKAVESSGSVISNMDVDIKCRASGEVITLPFDISQSVRKGELLCQLDPTDEQLAVRSADAAVTQAVAKLAQAKHELALAEQNLVTTRLRDEATLASAKVRAANLRAKADRQKELVQQQLGSREEMESADTEAASADAALESAKIAIEELKQQAIEVELKREAVKTADAQLQSDQVRLDTQKYQLAYTTVTAPVDGVVSALNVQKGTIVASGMSGFSGGTTIMTLSDLSRVFVIATVDESDIGGVRVDQAARITVTSFPGRTFVGKVVRIATAGVNTSNVVTFEVKVEVIDPHKDVLRPEMTGNVTIVQDQRVAALMLPSSAISHDGERTFVTTADGQQHAVTLGLAGSDSVEVLSGVVEGDRVRVVSAELPTRWKNTETGPGGGPPPP